MADRHARALFECGVVARARRASAQDGHAAARREEADAAHAQASAEGALAEVVADWQEQLASRFDPALGVMLARHMLDRAAAADGAAARHATAMAKREQAAAGWRAQDGLCRSLDEETRRAARRTARQVEERQLAGVGDRLTFTWSRP